MSKSKFCAIFLLALAALTGCSQDSHEKRLYELEKLRVSADRAEKIALGIKPELASKDDVLKLIAMYQEIVQKYKLAYPAVAGQAALSTNERQAAYLAGDAVLKTAQMYQLIGDTAKAIAALTGFETEFPQNPDQLKLAWLALGKIAEVRSQWADAETVYLKLVAKFDPPIEADRTPSLEILRLPYEMMQFYQQSGDSVKSRFHIDHAERYYQRLMTQYPKTNLGIVATRFLAETYRGSHRPQAAIELLRGIVDSTGQMTHAAMILTAQTYAEDLGDSSQAVSYYQRILDTGQDSAFTPRALAEMGRLLILERRFPEGRAKLSELISRHAYAREMLPEAQRIIAISYEEEKDYRQAQDAYQALMDAYPSHSSAFEAYLHMPEFFEKQDQKQLSDQWYNKAESYFIDTRDKYKDKTVGAAAQEYLCRLYAKYKKWDQAVAALKVLAGQFKDFQFATDANLRAGGIFETVLKLPDSARFYYEQQARMFPNSLAGRVAKKKLEEF